MVINNNVWHDAGSSDPMKVQGDLQFKADGKVNLEYGAQLFNETDTENTVDFGLQKLSQMAHLQKFLAQDILRRLI